MLFLRHRSHKTVHICILQYFIYVKTGTCKNGRIKEYQWNIKGEKMTVKEYSLKGAVFYIEWKTCGHPLVE